VVEIDAASNNSVDNIRDLREEVRYPPTQASYKVYIVDEVHMLSTSAFNALLKTLEEPPSHVIFILATTDPQKIPATILSRCQRYDFKRISSQDMIETMKRYLQAENTAYEDAALERIAYHSDGAMRDALSLLDQCLTLSGSADVKHSDMGAASTEAQSAIAPGGNLTLETVLKLLGAVDRQTLFAFTEALAAYDSAKILKIIDQNMKEGRDVAQLTNDLVRHFRDVLVAGQGAAPDYSAEILEKLSEQGSRISAEQLIAYIHAFSETLRELRFAPHMRTALEVCALRLCSPVMLTKGGDDARKPHSGELEGLLSRLAKLEHRVSSLTESASAVSSTAKSDVAPLPENSTAETLQTQSIPPQLAESSPTPPLSGNLTPGLLAQIKSDWISIVNTLSPMLRSTLIRCGLKADGAILQIVCDNESEVKFLKEKNRPLTIREALAERFNLSTPPNLAFIVSDPYNITAKPKNPVPREAPLQHPTNNAPPDAPFEAQPEAPAEVNLDQIQMEWSDFGQETGADDTVPF